MTIPPNSSPWAEVISFLTQNRETPSPLQRPAPFPRATGRCEALPSPAPCDAAFSLCNRGARPPGSPCISRSAFPCATGAHIETLIKLSAGFSPAQPGDACRAVSRPVRPSRHRPLRTFCGRWGGVWGGEGDAFPKASPSPPPPSSTATACWPRPKIPRG